MRSILILSAALFVAGCIPRVAPPPATPAPAPRPVPAPTPSPAPTGDWRDWPLTPGDWHYQQTATGGVSRFGVTGADSTFTIRCDRTAGRVTLSRAGTVSGEPAMTIVTTSETRALPSRPSGATPAEMTATLAPNDRLLDAMGYSRGRFVVEQAGLPVLVIPAWPEILRVTEDCRR